MINSLSTTYHTKLKIWFSAFMLVLACGFFADTNAQQLPNKITFKSTFLNYKLYQGDVYIGRERARALMLNCNPHLEKFNTGNQVLSVSTMFQLVSLVCLTGYATQRAFSENANPELLVAGVAIMVAGVAINISAKRQIAVAVGNYNIKCAKD
ncbi:MAG: hypothetical protein NWQ55_04785 [Salibacteraceae bacterium]|jgi:hypothetical protein|nr:hypothetical protein [Salibacteraceae bacterium]MDP4686016.1 hypothetical protein [Salibacteraceae bacterium]MDP4762754.1 hypothetical protein [Salibacteraceae bacterium]MDP4843917.1 hypothetical protein [Salibacteraceae bacterium]MDP4933412.1 hypothetical protein [Salibacteraceae bacterium]